MKLPQHIDDSKASSILKTRAKPLSPAKAQTLSELKEAVENMNLVKQGKLKARPLKEMLKEI